MAITVTILTILQDYANSVIKVAIHVIKDLVLSNAHLAIVLKIVIRKNKVSFLQKIHVMLNVIDMIDKDIMEIRTTVSVHNVIQVVLHVMGQIIINVYLVTIQK